MAKGSEPPRSAEQLKEVAIFLKQADKLVREGSYSQALDEIAKARARDPRNLYALAYEERVRSLVNASKDKAEKKAEGPQAPPQSIPPALEHISNLAIVEAQRSAAVAAKQEQELQLRKQEEDDRKKQEELRRQAIASKITAFLSRASDYEQKHDFNRALDEIARAYLLDPANEEIHSFEERIRKSQEEARIREEEERLRRQQEEERKRQELLKAQMARMQKEKEEKRKKEEEARRQAQQVKIQQYLKRARELFSSGRLDEALSELAFVVVIDPLNEEVLNLERQIRETQEQEQQNQLELLRKREEDQRKKRDAILQAIQKHIENADRLSELGKFSEALRVITRAYVLDPVNEALQACEKRIQVVQEEAVQLADEKRLAEEESVRKQQEEELRKLEQSERERALLGESAETEAKRRADKERIFQYLTKARAYFEEGRFEDALGEVALAFIVNPFDDDVKKMEQEVLRAQDDRKAQEEIAKAAEPVAASDGTAEKISEYLSEASKFAAEHEYSKALDEVAKAFMIDPLEESIQAYELQLQREFHEYQEQQKQFEEEENRKNAIATHLARAKEFLARAAFDEALAEVASGYVHDPDHAELKALEELIQNSYLQWQEKKQEEEKNATVDEHIFTAKKFLAGGMYDDALMEVTKAIVLDPTREDLKSLEDEIEQAQRNVEQMRQQEEADKNIQKLLFRAKEHIALRAFDDAIKELDNALAINPNDEDAKLLRAKAEQQSVDWTRQRAERERQQALKVHIKQARTLIANKVYDEALAEIALGNTIDSENEDLRRLEEEIINAQMELEAPPAAAQASAVEGDGQLSQEEKDQLVHIHLRAADEFQKQKEFAKALDEVAKAYVIDPLSKEIKRAEVRIRQNEIRHEQQTGQTLKLIYPNEKAAGGSQ